MKTHIVMTAVMLCFTTACLHAQNDAFREAVKKGDVVLVKSLIKQGWNVNRIYEHHSTLLMRSIAYGHLDVAQVLLEAGADPNVMDQKLWTATTLADEKRDESTRKAFLELLQKHGAKPGPLDTPSQGNSRRPATARPDAPDEQADQGRLRLLREHLEKEPHLVNQVDGDGQTLLMKAVTDGNAPMVTYLLSVGAHVGVKDYDGRTALNYIAKATKRPAEVRERVLQMLQSAVNKPTNGAGVTYQPAPRPLNGLTALKEAQDNPQPLDYFEAVAAFQKFSTLTEYQQMVLGSRAARWLRGNESIAGWAKQLLVANTNSQVHLPLVRMLISAQNNQVLSRQTIEQLEKAETDPKKLQIYKQMKP